MHEIFIHLAIQQIYCLLGQHHIEFSTLYTDLKKLQTNYLSRGDHLESTFGRFKRIVDQLNHNINAINSCIDNQEGDLNTALPDYILERLNLYGLSTNSISEIQRLLSIFQTLVIQINKRIDTNTQAPQLSHQEFISTVTRLDSLIQNLSTRLQTNEINTLEIYLSVIHKQKR